jgi:hypothetical protein
MLKVERLYLLQMNLEASYNEALKSICSQDLCIECKIAFYPPTQANP